MKLRFTIDVEVERTEGKFASKDDIAAEIHEWLDRANDGEISGVGADGDSIYEVVTWDVEQTGAIK